MRVQTAARTEGQLMLELAEAKANRSEPSFGDVARDFIIQYLRANGPRSCEVITNAAMRAGITPKDSRSFGGPFSSLHRRGFIMVDGTCERFKGHGTSGAKIWRLTREGDQYASEHFGVAA